MSFCIVLCHIRYCKTSTRIFTSNYVIAVSVKPVWRARISNLGVCLYVRVSDERSAMRVTYLAAAGADARPVTSRSHHRHVTAIRQRRQPQQLVRRQTASFLKYLTTGAYTIACRVTLVSIERKVVNLVYLLYIILFALCRMSVYMFTWAR